MLIDIKLNNKVNILHINYISADEIKYYLCNAVNYRGEIKQTGDIIEMDGLSQLSDSDSTPFIINFSGKIVLFKALGIRNDSAKDVDNALQKIVPGIDVNEFFVQQLVDKENNWFVSLVRRKYISDILMKLKSINILVVGISLGPMDLLQVFLEKFSDTTKAFEGSYYSFHSVNGIFSRVEQNTNQNKEDDLFIGHLYYTAYAWFNFTKSPDMHELKVNQQAFRFTYYTKKVLVLFLIIWFVILVLNFVTFKITWDKNILYKSELSSKNEIIQQLDSIKARARDNEALLKRMNVQNKTRYAYLSDRIGQTLLRNITLTEINIFPFSKDNDTTFFNTSQILISGKTNDINNINKWINILKEEEWISEISLSGYDKVSRNETGFFSLQLTVNYEMK